MSETFTYTTKAGTQITVPLIANLPVGVIRKARKSQVEAVFAVLEALVPEDSLEMQAIDAMQAAEFADFRKAWDAASGVSLGESSAS